jgi:hypothetical protein
MPFQFLFIGATFSIAHVHHLATTALEPGGPRRCAAPLARAPSGNAGRADTPRIGSTAMLYKQLWFHC